MLAGILFLFFGIIPTKTSAVFADISIGTHGPYRFLVDTGSDTSFIEPRLAAELGLEPRFRVELATQHGVTLAPGMKAGDLRLSERALPETELIFRDPTETKALNPSIRGILGANALAGFNFTLDTESARLDAAPHRPPGEAISFYRVEGRIALKARMDKESLMLILDSGSNHVVLFHTPSAMAKTAPVPAAFTTLEGARSVVPTLWSADLYFSERLRVGTLPAAIVKRDGRSADGLMPTAVFKKIYVDQVRNELVLVR